FLFFFSSRRRHTRSDRDWSSDVCSSDLINGPRSKCFIRFKHECIHPLPQSKYICERIPPVPLWIVINKCDVLISVLEGMKGEERSEERRVGKECRCGWWGEY